MLYKLTAAIVAAVATVSAKTVGKSSSTQTSAQPQDAIRFFD